MQDIFKNKYIKNAWLFRWNMLGATSLKLIIHYNPCLWRRFYSISMNLSRVFSKKDRLIFLPCLCNFWGVGLKFDKQILNHVAFFCNTFFQIFLTHFQEKCNTFFQILLTYFLKKCKKFLNFFASKCHTKDTYKDWLLPTKIP